MKKRDQTQNIESPTEASTVTPKFSFLGYDSSDIPGIWLVISNALLIAQALHYDWPISVLLWAYWWQNILLGITTIVRMLSLTFVTEGTSDYHMEGDVAKREKRKTALFFAGHYGIFNLVFWLGLSGSSISPSDDQLTWFIVSNVAFTLTQFLALHAELKKDKQEPPSISVLMVAPYFRIIPMFIFLFFGWLFSWSVLFFGMLKSVADVWVWGLQSYPSARFSLNKLKKLPHNRDNEL